MVAAGGAGDETREGELMAESSPRESLGMTAQELEVYLEELLRDEAIEAAERNGTSPAQELASAGFAAARAASSYTIHLIAANNAFLSRSLLDLGLLDGVGPDDDTADE